MSLCSKPNIRILSFSLWPCLLSLCQLWRGYCDNSGRGSCSVVWFLLAHHQLCRPKEQAWAVLRRTVKHPEQWMSRGYQSHNFYVKKSQDLSALNISGVHVKQEGEKFFRPIQSTAGGSGRNTDFFRCSPEQTVKRKHRLCREQMKEHWNEGTNAGEECFCMRLRGTLSNLLLPERN